MSSTRGHSRARVLQATGAIVATAAAVLALGLPATAQASHTPHVVTPHTGLRAGVMPLVHRPPVRQSTAPAGAHLTYNGGKVISNVHVIQVLWGSGTYESQVQNTASPSVATFYQGVTNSSYYDWLNEYNTTNNPGGVTGTNQVIGRGSFVTQVQITPSAANNTNPVDDTQIQPELQAQINAGHLPAPDGNTLYALYFRAGQTITQGGSSSGVQFCAYHGTVAAGSTPEFYYSVLPDFSTGGMTTGCGSGTEFQNVTSVSSHELVEATTDAEVGIAVNNTGPPLAWYDQTNGEIGDICNGQQATVTGGDGVAYTVQKEFSNLQNNCVVSGPTQTNDFSMSLNPTSVSVAPASSGTSTVSTAVTSGSPVSVALSATGAPSGATVTFNPASVTAGNSSTLSVTTTSSVAAGTYTVTVKGTGPTTSHTAPLSLTVTGGGGGGGGVVNGGFESGTLNGWTSTGTTAVVSSGAQAGTYAARVGSTSPSTDSSIAQTFTATTGATGLQFWYNVHCPDSVTYDWATATLRDNTAATTSTVLPKTCVNPSSGWRSVSAGVTAGHSYTLTLSSHDDNYPGDPTYTLYDSVALTSGGGGGGGGITNGGFETGSFSGWTTSGAHTAIVTTSHSGAYAAMAGNTTPTNGDSTISQTFTAPSGTSHLGLWYLNSCPDTVTYDWVTVTLKDNTTNVTTTVVAKRCASSATWTSASAAVTAGHSYTLNLISHDDNYGADPTYTLFDDIGLS